MNSKCEFIVATPAIFIGGGELEKVMGHFPENASLEGGRRACDRRHSSRRLPGSNWSPLGEQWSHDRLPHSPPPTPSGSSAPNPHINRSLVHAYRIRYVLAYPPV